MIKRIIEAFAALVVSSSFVLAGVHGIPGVTAPNGIQMNIGRTDDGNSSGLVNFIKTSSVTFSGGATPGTAALDLNGYPTQSFTGDMAITVDQTLPGAPYTIIWEAGTKLKLLNNTASSSCSLTGTGGSITGCASTNVTLTIDGTGAGSLTFTGGVSPILQGIGSYGVAGTANLAIIQTANLTRYNACVAAGTVTCMTSGLLNILQTGNYKTIRMLDWNRVNAGRETKLSYRSKPSHLSWKTQYPLGAWSGGINSAGTISGTDIWSAAIATDQPTGTWVQGEVLQGALAVASSAAITVTGAADNGSGLCRLTVNSSATITTGQLIWAANILSNAGGNPPIAGCNGEFLATVIDGTHVDLQASSFPAATTFASTGAIGVQTLTVAGKTGTKFVASLQGLPLRFNFDTGLSAGIVTFSYDAVLDKIIGTSGSYSVGYPLESSISMANQINANLWMPIPYMVEDAWIQDLATVALGLKQGLYFYPEYGNEPWNVSFQGTVWSGQRGFVFGFPAANVEQYYGYYSLRTRQIMGDLIPSIWSSRLQYFRPVMNFQAFGAVSLIQTYGLNSADLAPLGTSTGKGNSAYVTYTSAFCTYVGSSCPSGADYTTFPNRSGDRPHLVMSYAPYSSGTNLGDQGLNGGRTASANNATWLQTQATLFAANANDPTAIAALNTDQLQGTQQDQVLTCPTGSTFTLSSHGFSNTGSFYALVTATGGTVCNGLSVTQAYCFIGVTTNTFQLGAYNITTASCSGASAISVSPGTGTVSIGAIAPSLPLVLNSTIYPKFEVLAASYDAQRIGGGLDPIRVEWYEGASQPVVPTGAALATLGVTVGGTGAAANTALTNGVIAWRNNVVSQSFIQAYYNYFLTYSHSKTPSNLTLIGAYTAAVPYGFIGSPTQQFAPDINSAYQTYYGAAALQTQNFLLKRDMQKPGSSNDNDPMFLEKAA